MTRQADNSEFLAEIHGRAKPTDVRETDKVVARARERGTTKEFEDVRVWRLSPLGVEFLIPVDHMEEFAQGQTLDLQLVVEGRRSEIVGYIVSVSENPSGRILGARFLSESKSEQQIGNRDSRAAMRWVCSEHHLPRAVAASPGRFNHFIGFQVRNISVSGLMLVTDIENSFLIPKMKLMLSISLPMVGETILEVELVWLRIGSSGGSDVLEIGARVHDIDQRSKALLGQYLVQFAQDVSINSLIAAGFTPENIELGIEFLSLKSESEYAELLDLRAKEDGTNLPGSAFAHESDKISRIIVGRLGGRVIVAARVRYPELQDTLACEVSVPWPESQPRPDQLIEVDGICSISSRREQTVLALFKYICTACTSGSRKTVLVYSDQKALFESVGWEGVGKIGGAYVLVGDAYEAIKGRNTNPFRWNFVWRDSALFLMETESFQPSGTSALILKLYLALGPISRLVYSLKKRLRM
ncbi:MAG: PilZ domain-containing protein [Pseudomonadota bacterium]